MLQLDFGPDEKGPRSLQKKLSTPNYYNNEEYEDEEDRNSYNYYEEDEEDIEPELNLSQLRRRSTVGTKTASVATTAAAAAVAAAVNKNRINKDDDVFKKILNPEPTDNKDTKEQEEERHLSRPFYEDFLDSLPENGNIAKRTAQSSSKTQAGETSDETRRVNKANPLRKEREENASNLTTEGGGGNIKNTPTEKEQKESVSAVHAATEAALAASKAAQAATAALERFLSGEHTNNSSRNANVSAPSKELPNSDQDLKKIKTKRSRKFNANNSSSDLNVELEKQEENSVLNPPAVQVKKLNVPIISVMLP